MKFGIDGFEVDIIWPVWLNAADYLHETVKQQSSNSKIKDKWDKTTYPLIIHIIYRTVVRSLAGNKRDVRYANALKSHKSVYVMLDLQETLDYGTSWFC
jgi:hypothetical protein